MSSADTTRLRELAGLFLKLGTTAFGGPAAHIALMETEVVRRRQWLTHAEFLDLLGLANLIPGPSSTELAIFIGHRRAGNNTQRRSPSRRALFREARSRSARESKRRDQGGSVNDPIVLLHNWFTNLANHA